MLCKRMSLGAYRANHLFQKMLLHNVRASRPNRQPPVRQSVSSTMTRGGATLAPGQVYERMYVGYIPFHARPFHVGPNHVGQIMSGHFMSVPFHVSPISCPNVPFHARPISCWSHFMSGCPNSCQRGPFHVRPISCWSHFMLVPFHVGPISCPYHSMPCLSHNPEFS